MENNSRKIQQKINEFFSNSVIYELEGKLLNSGILDDVKYNYHELEKTCKLMYVLFISVSNLKRELKENKDLEGNEVFEGINC